MKKINTILIVFWLLVVGGFFSWNLSNQKKAHQALALETARAFFTQIVMTRSWNAGHGGVYVETSESTVPNPYLADDPRRDIESDQGVKLTKVNPAFMTRQIGEIAAREHGVQFHITSLQPIRPENKPLAWEAAWLRSFQEGHREQGEFVQEGAAVKFRYMAPLYVKASCLECHARHGYKEGDIRGGISVILPFFHTENYLPMILGYGVAGLLGLLVILISGHLLTESRKNILQVNTRLAREVKVRQRAEAEQGKLIVDLQAALSEIKTLRGILPICAHCKKVRDDKGYWARIEEYLHTHSEAQLTHGICPQCKAKYYSELRKHTGPEK